MAYVCDPSDNHAVIVCPGRFVCFLARRGGGHVHAVVDGAVFVDQQGAVHPVICFLGPLGVRVILREHGQSSADVE